jgi:uncharacterized protein YjbJ (UPF0337 family)
MGLGDKIENAAEDAKGKAKEGFGKATNDEQTEAEGKLDQQKAEAKGKVEDAKDALAGKYNEATE